MERENTIKGYARETRQEKLLEMFPNARMYGATDIVGICPRDMDKNFECKQANEEVESILQPPLYVTKAVCKACLKKYWLAEVNE